MLRILHHTKIDFIKSWRIAAVLTAMFIAIGLGVHAARGFNLNKSIEFTGGTLVQVEFAKAPSIADIRSTVEGAGFPGAEIQQFGSPRDFTVRAASHTAAQLSNVELTARQIETALHQRFGATEPRIIRSETVSPRVGDELSRNAIIAIVISLFVTLCYLAFRFEWRFGVAAVLATAHDLLSTLAFLVLMNLEVSLTVIAALLTVIGYSLNDTIIIFDRVRENLKKARPEPLYDVLNRSINETLPRSILTHVTVAAATLSLLIFAGEVIRPFSWIMLFGIVTGTFSSIYVAAPILLWIERKWPRAQDGRSPVRSPQAGPTRPAPERSPVAARTR